MERVKTDSHAIRIDFALNSLRAKTC